MKLLQAAACSLGLAALLAAPAQAAHSPANPGDCAPAGVMSKPFSPFGDAGLYTPVENGGLENGSASWALAGGATVGSGNEPWFVGGAGHSKSLNLPGGATATTSSICIDETYTHFRVFARNTGAAGGQLKIEVLYFDTKGKLISTKPFAHRNPTTAWVPSASVPIEIFGKHTTTTVAPVAFRFSVSGRHAAFQLDDVYVDPWARS